MDDAVATNQSVEAWLGSLASPNTQSAYRGDLAVFAAWCAARQVSPLQATATDAEEFRSDLVAGGARESTANRRASAVHSFLRAQRGAKAREPEAGDGSSSTVLLNDDERDRLIGVLPDQSTTARVLIGLLLFEGLKLNEALNLDVADVSGRLPQLDVAVSRGTAELFTLHATTSTFLHDHLVGRSVGPLLTGRSHDESRLTRFGADYLVKRAGRDAGLDAPLTTNMLRRAYVSHAHHAGDHVEDIRRRVGHHDIRATRRLLPVQEPGGTGPTNESPTNVRR